MGAQREGRMLGITLQLRRSKLAEHAVIVKFDYGRTDLGPLFEVEEQLEQVIAAAGVGEYDGNEVAIDGRDGVLYMYGPDADALFSAVQETLRASECLSNAVATLRYGPPADDVRRVQIALTD